MALTAAHDIYELLAEQKDFVTELNALTDAVHTLEMEKFATDLDFRYIEKDIKNLGDELARLTQSLGVIDNTLGQTSKRTLGLDKDTSAGIMKEVEDITSAMNRLDEKIKKIETKQIDNKINRAMSAPSQNEYLESKLSKISENAANVESGGSSYYWMYALLGLICVILTLTWWSFHRAETKAKLPSFH